MWFSFLVGLSRCPVAPAKAGACSTYEKRYRVSWWQLERAMAPPPARGRRGFLMWYSMGRRGSHPCFQPPFLYLLIKRIKRMP